ncbi:hypothetical protein BJX99DRAFT_259020 [Aspergillus californicus]
MPLLHQISNILALTVLTSTTLCIQAHLTPRFTPALSRKLAEKLPQHNRAVFWWLGISDNALRYVFVSFNLLVSVLLALPSLRGLGMMASLGLLGVGLYSDVRLGESPVPHLGLIGVVCVAVFLR